MQNPFDRAVCTMMARFGTSAIILAPGSTGVYDPATSTWTASETDYTVNAIIFDFTLKKEGLGFLPNTLIEEGNKQIFIQPNNKSGNKPFYLPQPNKDRIQIGNDIYRITNVKQLNTTMNNSIFIELIAKI
jgi:hypothetical protein